MQYELTKKKSGGEVKRKRNLNCLLPTYLWKNSPQTKQTNTIFLEVILHLVRQVFHLIVEYMHQLLLNCLLLNSEFKFGFSYN